MCIRAAGLRWLARVKSVGRHQGESRLQFNRWLVAGNMLNLAVASRLVLYAHKTCAKTLFMQVNETFHTDKTDEADAEDAAVDGCIAYITFMRHLDHKLVKYNWHWLGLRWLSGSEGGCC